MCPNTCWRFSVPTRTRYSPSPPASREPQVLRPSKSPTLVISSPHWLASRLITFTPSAAPSSMAETGERKCTCVSAVTQPCSRQGRTFSSLDLDLLRLGRDLDDLAHRPDLEAFGDLDVDLAQRQLDQRLAVDVGAGVGTGQVVPVQDVGEVHAVILEPGRVEDAVAVHRRQVFAPFAVDVQLDRHRPAAAALDDAQRDRLLGGRDRADGASGAVPSKSAPSTSDTGITRLPSGREVETGFRVGGVLDQDLAGGKLRQLVVVALLPGVVRVDQARRGRDHLPQIELDLLEQAHPRPGPAGRFRPPGSTRRALRRGCQRKGSSATSPAEMAEITTAPAAGSKRKPAISFLGMGVLPGPQPVHPRAIIRGHDARLAPAPRWP